MMWIRASSETDRRPIDVARLVFCGLTFVVLGVWAQSQSAVDVNLFATINSLSANMVGAAKAVYALGSVWAVVAVALLLLAFRHVGIALRVALAGVGAWGIAELVNDLLGDHVVQGIQINVRYGSGPAFPDANVAVVTALF